MIIRTYTDEENDIVKVWTPEMVAHVKELSPIGGFDTYTLKIDEDDAKRYGISEFEYDVVMYVDNAMSICRNTSGWDSVLCQEHVKDRILYRCSFCHEDKRQNMYCKGTTSAGRRCSQIVRNPDVDQDRFSRVRYDDYDDYCRWHNGEREQQGWRFDLDKLDEWLDGHQRETIMLWKRNLLQRLRVLEDLTLDQILSIKKVVDRVREGTYKPRELPTKSNTYFIWCDGYVKIGHSKDPLKRFDDLCRENDTTIRPEGVDMKNAKLLGWVAGDIYIERYLHGAFSGASKWVAGEWFHYDTEAAVLIDVILSDKEWSIGYVLEDLVKNYDTIISHDVQGGLDFKPNKEYYDKLRETFSLDAVLKRDNARIDKYGY